jgi:hypothetical protein
MEPQFMILGHAAGVVAALVAMNASGGGGGMVAAVQDVDLATVAALLAADGQLTKVKPPASTYGCKQGTCLLYGGTKSTSPGCGGQCPPLTSLQWLALRAHWHPPSTTDPTHLLALHSTVLKKSEALSQGLPGWAVQPVGVSGANASVRVLLSTPAVVFDGAYYLLTCAHANCTQQ